MTVIAASPDPARRAIDIFWDDDSEIRPTEQIHTHRAWHTLHVLLTGQESGGQPPATYVVEDGSVRLEWSSGAGTMTLLAPADVVAVAAYLDAVPFGELLATRLPRMRTDGDLCVYSFASWDPGPDTPEASPLWEVFDELKRFYQAAANAGEAVIKNRG
ncbi:DUF1877 family protein [Krasilnikovia sp. MM14-A1259]|uniref:DUF1877 family protein n=1 Tax=Krasilnikovia sp. MM14-A1259 TaxID=3373539 RepID=UPI00399C4E0D